MAGVFQYVKNQNFSERYVSPEKLFSYLQDNLSDYISEIGKSSLGKPIYKLSLGNGPVKVAAWSQMHGNESTATLAMLDLLEFFKENDQVKQKLFSALTLDFIFMLNPDGSEIWTRRNAFDIDINRDFLKESSIELRLLKDFIKAKKYDYALNLHDQRTIFSASDDMPATLSFLAPSEDIDRSLTENRKKSMAIIAGIFIQMQNFLPKQIARYNDEFYPTSAGDNLMKSGIPTILFEGGFYPDDYGREKTRKFYTYALFYALKAMAVLRGDSIGYETYFSIPENKESHFDIIYRNVKLNTNFDCVLDVAVQYKEIFDEEIKNIKLVPYVVEIGDLGRKKGWKEIDCTGKNFVSDYKFPKLDAEINFRME
ncbi:M14 family zinc carboxypeptidase [Soonwooa sp.]|uniref:M14 family zinc carboxypeptidase n=1 Tax=Soonwooa sp. TaxID=1938592 RepID=UPI0028A21996|nr:M14 family zinc carboxypeptidase [Soonwooa sp.]